MVRNYPKFVRPKEAKESSNKPSLRLNQCHQIFKSDACRQDCKQRMIALQEPVQKRLTRRGDVHAQTSKNHDSAQKTLFVHELQPACYKTYPLGDEIKQNSISLVHYVMDTSVTFYAPLEN